MLASDYLVDIGPKAGKHGGEIVQGEHRKRSCIPVRKRQYLLGKKKYRSTEGTAKRKNGKFIELKGVEGNNLRRVDVSPRWVNSSLLRA